MEPRAEQSPDRFKELRKCGSLVLYELDPKVPNVYVVPIQSILGKLPLVPVGDTGSLGPFLSSLRHAHGLSVRLLPNNSTSGLTVTLQRVLAIAAVSGMLIHLPWDGPRSRSRDD